jgi:acetyltransferase
MNAAAHGPLPTELIDVWRLAGGARVVVRPVLPQDAALEQALVRALSPASRYQRFLAPVRELPPAWLERLTQLDFRSHVALIAETFDAGRATPVAEARYVVDEAEPSHAEFAIVVADAWRRHGIARRLLAMLGCHALASGLRRLHGETLADNRAMIQLARSLGYRAGPQPGDARLVRLALELHGDGDQAPCWAAHPAAQAIAERGATTAAY